MVLATNSPTFLGLFKKLRSNIARSNNRFCTSRSLFWNFAGFCLSIGASSISMTYKKFLLLSSSQISFEYTFTVNMPQRQNVRLRNAKEYDAGSLYSPSCPQSHAYRCETIAENTHSIRQPFPWPNVFSLIECVDRKLENFKALYTKTQHALPIRQLFRVFTLYTRLQLFEKQVACFFEYKRNIKQGVWENKEKNVTQDIKLRKEQGISSKTETS